MTDLLGVVHRLADCDNAHPPRLALVTRGSQATGTEQAPIALAQAPLWTVARVAALEHPRLPILRLDLEAGSVDPQIAAIAAELLYGDGEPEVVFREGARLVPRLHRLDTPDADRLPLPADEPFALHIGRERRRGAPCGAAGARAG